MNTGICEKKSEQHTLKHSLGQHLAALSRFNSTAALKSSDLYRKLEPEIERLLNTVEREQSFALANGQIAGGRAAVRATAWNIERGTKFEGIVDVLSHHALIGESDVLLLTELDYGMARSGNRHVAREIARAVRMHYAFAPSYINLEKGSGLDRRAQGENEEALHGNAIFSRYPLANVHSISLPNGKDKMQGHEKRIGSQRAVIADVVHPLGKFRAVSLHLDAHSSQRHRWLQMKLVLDHLDALEPSLPVLIGGDWNTSTYNSSRAIFSILGFFRRVLMGVQHVLRNHYVHPRRWFERRLFGELSNRGYIFEELNETGVGTLHYDVKDLAANSSMADWVPRWCFWWLNWALKENDGRCSLKLDWFAGKGVSVSSSQGPRVVSGLRGKDGKPLSDHDPIVVNFETTDARS